MGGNLLNTKGIFNTNPYSHMMKQTQVGNRTSKPDEVINPVKKDRGDTVEMTRISDADKAELERRAALGKVSPTEGFGDCSQ